MSNTSVVLIQSAKQTNKSAFYFHCSRPSWLILTSVYSTHTPHTYLNKCCQAVGISGSKIWISALRSISCQVLISGVVFSWYVESSIILSAWRFIENLSLRWLERDVMQHLVNEVKKKPKSSIEKYYLNWIAKSLSVQTFWDFKYKDFMNPNTNSIFSQFSDLFYFLRLSVVTTSWALTLFTVH